MMRTLNYFAYGSNLHPLRLKARIGDCQLYSVAQLEGARLCFHKVGLDASGKCDIELPAQKDSTVWGAVYQISSEQKLLLDQHESLGKGYQLLETKVRLADQQYLPVFTYQAMTEFIDPRLRPFDWYHDYVTQGVSYHQFPAAYRAMIHAVKMIEDPDQARSERHQSFLRELRKTIEAKLVD